MKKALVLAGGGSKGAYEAGCVKALRELGYHFDIVTGTSIGALNGLLVVQEDYDALMNLWQTIKISDVLQNPVNFNFSIDSMISQTNLIMPFFKSYIGEKGADITPLKNLIHGLYNEEKVFSSNIDYGIVTVKYPKLTALEITKKEMQASEPVEYAIASASCFPAFPVHYLNNQGYIDGGYYDNLPISLALEMGAQEVVAIELNQEANHEYFVDRPYITLIRPSYDLGGFLDFGREMLDFRMKLGYFDTLKTFKKLYGYRYTFNKMILDKCITDEFYWLILKYENVINKSIVNKTIANTSLTALLLENTYLKCLTLDDYFIRGVEIMMAYYQYQSDLLYDFNQVTKEIHDSFIEEYNYQEIISNHRFFNLPVKEIFLKLKSLTSKEVINFFYHSLKHDEEIEASLISNIFLKEYLIALLLTTLD